MRNDDLKSFIRIPNCEYMYANVCTFFSNVATSAKRKIYKILNVICNNIFPNVNINIVHHNYWEKSHRFFEAYCANT